MEELVRTHISIFTRAEPGLSISESCLLILHSRGSRHQSCPSPRYPPPLTHICLCLDSQVLGKSENCTASESSSSVKENTYVLN
ncbi:hypothetical protein YC2023_047220 [Brassica napus]